MNTRRTGYTLLGLMIATLTIMSCTTLLGIDTETTDNPCNAPDLPPLECGVGACQVVLPACVNGLPQSCPPVTSTADEICDGIDNNCDGLIDEGCPCMDAQVQNCYSGAPLTRNVGVCITGDQICTNGVWGDCTAEVLPDLENCNDNFDNDCNGAVNDNCPCTEGQQRECYGGPPSTLGVSSCKAGLQSCIKGFWGDCKSDIIPGGEVCDGVDNDCNGKIDEITGCECSNDQTQECYTGDEKLIGIGICKKGLFPCKGGKFDKTKCLTETLPSAEVCNGLDDDCNGTKDDAQGLGLDCTTKLPGLCKFGKTGCGIDDVTGMPGTICTPDVKPFSNPEQACNLVDDNCNDEVDEGTVCCPGDGIQNGSETDVNCGGTCPERCPDGKKCNTSMDCLSQVCTSGICVPITCADGVENGTETDIDCGGTTCDGCPATKKCDFGTDCLSSVCINNKCQQPTCIDGVKNGQESDKDCGDACKPALCANLQSCNNALDCQSFSCLGNICQASTCGDSTKNGSETDIDCGGGQCVGCNTGQGCNSGSDCKEKVCGANLKCLAPTCVDAASNGQETDVDCGGPDCVKRCDTGQKCLLSNDCTSKICTNGFCAPSQCTDQVQNGTETDVDCGGSCIEKCNPTQKCLTGLDCKSAVCTGGICQAPSCMDMKKNGTETGIDCGGSCINEQKKCADGITCSFGGDCISGVCNNGVCFASQCNDQVKNGTETDIDCGGQSCQGCDIGKNCLNGPDCKTAICSGGKCAPKPNGTTCITGTECASGNCVDTVCCDTACTGTCLACTATLKGNGADGICGAIVPAAGQQAECTVDPVATCGRTGVCNGSGACQNYPVTTQCVAASCKDLVTRNLPQFCNGVGACLTSVEQTCVPYTCQAGGCLSTCALDSQCAGGFYCNTNQCVPKKADGGTCNFSNECLNANCVDGVCCNSACTGACQACSAGKKGSGVDGVCGPIVINADPDNECATTAASTCGTTGACDGTGKCAQWANGTVCAAASCVNSTTQSPSSTCNGSGTCTATMQIPCAPYQCKNNACASICATNLDCAAGNYCVLTSCVAQKGDGASCLGNSECVNGNCVDGVCCNNACTGLCQACSAGKKGAGADGTCGNITNNGDPDNECMDGQCADATTLNVTQVCNGAGACKVGTTATCTPYVCSNGPACPTTCLSDANCQSTHYCNASNLCTAKKAAGQVCVLGGECSSGFCADGVCCNEACAGTCRACSVAAGAGTNGTCANIPNNGTDTNPVCGGTDVCNGSGVCKKGLGQVCAGPADCSSNFCADNVCCNNACVGTCDACTTAKKGQGTDGTCGPIITATDPDNECTNGSCNGASTCKLDLGAICGGNAACLSNFCVDGVCCNNACAGTCDACSAVKKGQGTDGTCGSIITATDPDNECTNGSCNGASTCKLDLGSTCAGNTACLSNFCVDSVCCNNACVGTCDACTAAKKGQGTSGTCGPIITATDPDNECTNGSCNGVSGCQLDPGSTCTVPGDCLSNFCVDNVCCNNACTGTCDACTAAKKGQGTSGTCGPIITATDPDNECVNGSCNGASTCKLDLGATCAGNTACLSGFCADNVCCNNACAGTCDACTAAIKGQGTDGTCGPIITATDPANECVNGSCNGASACKLDIGATCAGNSACLSNFCVDNVCCNNACIGTCDACTAAKKGQGTDGTCGPIITATDPDNECANGSCNGASTCLFDQGATCAGNSACLSNFCVDSVCCNNACVGTCDACSAAKKGQGTNGTCGPIITATDPDNECTNGSCNGASTCKLDPGSTCAAPSDCLSNFCADNVCCNNACLGTCDACTAAKKGQGTSGTCGPIITATDPDNECVNGSCNGASTCKLDLGATCAGNAACLSNFCVDNVCCNNACVGTCDACTAAIKGQGTDGTCGPIITATDPANECVNGSCNGASACKLDLGVTCAGNSACLSNFCADSVCCNNACSGTCDACTAAKKGQGTSGTCGPIITTTDPDNECVNGSCNGASTCKIDLGFVCAFDTDCFSGACVDGVCCNVASCGSCQTCNKNLMTAGTCQFILVGLQDNVPANTCSGAMTCDGAGNCVTLKANGATCGSGPECNSGNCVDTVCCDNACNTECKSCNVLGSVGTCSNIPNGQTDTLPACNANGQTCNGSGVCKKLDGATCGGPTECISGVCSTTCQAPTCGDGVKNGNEADMDCGASCPSKCILTKTCNTSNDCESNNCSGGFCVAPSCTDGAQNGNETDVDCGGSCATKCANGTSCIVNGDCANSACNRGLCVPATCNNGMQDGTETGIDCGGSASGCQICPTLLVLYTQGTASPYTVQYGSYIGGTWTTSSLAGTTAIGTPSIAISRTRYAIGVVRSGTDDLYSARWIGTTNGWTSLTSLPGSPKANGIPSTISYGPNVETAFRYQGGANKYFTARYSGSSWLSTFQPTGAPSNATVYDIDWIFRDPSGTATLVYPEETSADPFLQTRTNNSWGAAAFTNGVILNKNFAPNIVQLNNGDLFMTFVQTDNKIYWTKFSGGSWSAPAVARDNAGNDKTYTTARPGLVVMPNGNVILVYANSSNSNRLHAAIYDLTNGWNTTAGTAITAAAVSSVTTAPGLPGYDVEVVYHQSGTFGHTRRNSSNSGWEFPTVSGFGTVQAIGAASFR